MPANRRSRKFEPLIADIVESATLIPAYGDLLEHLNVDRDELVQAYIREAIPDEQRSKILNFAKNQVTAFEDPIQAALPEGLQTRLRDYSDLSGELQAVHAEVAYAVGVAVARRLGGGK